MKRYSLISVAFVFLIALVWIGCNNSQAPVAPGMERMATKPVGIDRARAVQDRYTDRLMGLPGVVGTALGLGSDGNPVIKVLAESRRASGIPRNLEGIPVETEVTGKVVALARIGTSTGNAKECAAGTIGVRVIDGRGRLNVLSNNHVFARENKARSGEQILSPGLFDAQPQCFFDPQTVIGTLAGFVKIQFGAKANKVDAAIALLSVPVDNVTPSGYTPNATPVAAFVNQTVRKYGRTTGETRGTVTGVNVTVRVQYKSGVATFSDQIQIGPGGFSAAGDSGSLIVTDNGSANPVGLLFAGSSTTTFANRIQNVTSALGVTVDGTP